MHPQHSPIITLGQGTEATFYRRAGNRVERSIKLLNGDHFWHPVVPHLVPINVARFLLTEYDNLTPPPYWYTRETANHMHKAAIECLLKTESDNLDGNDCSSLKDNGCTNKTLNIRDFYQLLEECQSFLLLCQRYGVTLDKTTIRVGEDLILTRNGHGNGYSDKPGEYGRDYLFLAYLAERFTELHAQRNGVHWELYGFASVNPGTI